MAAVSSNDSLQLALERVAHVHHVVLLHLLPLLLNRQLQLGNITVTNSTRLGLHLPPDTEVEGVQIGALWRPKMFRPKFHVTLHPTLHHPRGVRGCAVLLVDVGCLARLLGDLNDLWKHLGLQDFQVVGSIEAISSIKPNRGHLLACRCHNAQHHHRGRVLRSGNVA